jgi:hypothetical protein
LRTVLASNRRTNGLKRLPEISYMRFTSCTSTNLAKPNPPHFLIPVALLSNGRPYFSAWNIPELFTSTHPRLSCARDASSYRGEKREKKKVLLASLSEWRGGGGKETWGDSGISQDLFEDPQTYALAQAPRQTSQVWHAPRFSAK